MLAESPDELPLVRPEQIRPYASAVILEYTGPNPEKSIEVLIKRLQQLKTRSRFGRGFEIIASGLSMPPDFSLGQRNDDSDPNATLSLDVDGFICRVTAPPSWARADSLFIETSLDLVVALGRRRLIAVHCDSGLVESIQSWLDKSPKPPFSRIPPGVLNAALLTGEAKGLWLRGTHARRTTKADSKNISGRRLQDALSPLEDSSFSMGSARAELPAGEIYGALAGTIGTTPRKSLVWISRTTDFMQFAGLICDLLILIESTLAAGASVDSPYPWLATELRSLNGVRDAYEITTLSVEEIPRTPDWPEEAVEAASLLGRATFNVIGNSKDANFVADVGLDGSVGGRIRGVVKDENGVAQINFGWDAESNPTDEPSVRMVMDSLEYTDLITIYYGSGHAISSGSVWSAAIREAVFPGWEWQSFETFNLRQEKPNKTSSQEIHDAIAEGGDDSLFAWVVSSLGQDGWLTCDDGPGEIADFVKYDGDGTVSLIHVKAATSDNPNRPVNVTSYEVVTSQATKNLTYLNTELLIDRLSVPNISRPACWYNGQRINDRVEMLEFLSVRPAQAPLRVMVVQPQMSKARYDRSVASGSGSIDNMRLKLLETMLNAARGAVTGLGADLRVIASL